MSTGTSSLRRTKRRGGIAVGACSVLAAALSTPALAASGPTPDNPPVGARSEAAPRIAEEAPTSESSGSQSPPTQAPSSGSLAPTPDAPATAANAAPKTSTKATTRHAPRPAPTPVVVTATPAPTSTSTSTPTTPHPTTAPSMGRTTKAAGPPPSRKGHRSAPRAPHVEKKTAVPAKVVSVPRDGSRLGLPAATAVLSAVSSDSARTALLAAAALLLLAAAAGGLVVGIVGRRLTRPA